MRFRVHPDLASALVLGLALLLTPGLLATDASVKVPIALQAELLSKVARYDQNLSERAGTTLRVLVLHRRDDSESATHARQLKSALEASPVLADRPQEVSIESMGSAVEVASACKARRLAIVVLSSGFSGSELRTLGEALKGQSVLTLGLSAQAAEQGTVLSFDVVASKPKIVVNVGRAKNQQVQLASGVLALARVVQ